MTIKYFTIQNPPGMLAEQKSELPDECRQSDFVPLPTLLERFIASGEKYQEYMGAQSLSAEEKEAMFSGVETDDLDDDIAVQKAFADEVMSNISSKQVKEEKPTQQQAAPEKAESKESA